MPLQNKVFHNLNITCVRRYRKPCIAMLSLSHQSRIVEIWYPTQYGICMEYVENRYGIGMEYVLNMCGVCMEHVWNRYGIDMEYVWNTYGIGME